MQHMKNTILALACACTAAGALFAAPVELLEPSDGAVVPTLTDPQKEYLAMPRDERRGKFANASYRRNEMGLPAETVGGVKREAYWPKTVRLAWKSEDGVEYSVKVVEKKSGRTVFDEKVKGGEAYVDNLEIASGYEWSVASGDDAAKRTFRTEDKAPRLVRYPGVPNVRDLGGRIGLGGRRVRQGLVFRSAGLNSNASDTYYTREELERMGRTEELGKSVEEARARLAQLEAWQKEPATFDRRDGDYVDWTSRHPNDPPAKFLSSRIHRARELIKKGGEAKVKKGRMAGRSRVEGERGEYICSRFGIKSDIDLRSDGECYGMTGSPLGPAVTWFHYSSSAYGGMQSSKGRDAFRNVFRVFLDKDNYPIDFHCIAGQDRTGAVAFILNALLGVSEEELSLDWETTGFWNRSSSFNHEKNYDHLVSGFRKKYPAETINESVEKYVVDLGFTKEEIDSFREFMLEPASSVQQ